MKRTKKIAWLLSFLMIFSMVFENVSLRVAAENTTPGNVEISIQNNQNGTVEYKLGDTGSWTEITAQTFTLRTTDELSSFSSGNIYLKATPYDEQSLDSGEGKNTLNDGSTSSGIDTEALKNGTYSFAYENTKAYNIQISFAGSSNPPQSNGGLKLDISNKDSATGTVTYTFLNESDSSLGTDTVSVSTTSNIAFPEGTTKVNIKVIPSENFQVGYYGVNLDGQSVSEANMNDAIGTDGNTIPVSDTSKEYQVQVEFAASGDGGNGGDAVPADAISFIVEGDRADAAIQAGAVEYSLNGSTWIKLTSSSVSLDSGVASAQIRVTDSTGAWDLTSYNIIEDGGIIKSGKAYAVNEKKEYHIQIDKKVYTVIWAYDNSQGDDAFVEHGKVEIVNAVADGKTEDWSGIEPTDLPGANNNQQDDRGGRVAIIPGSTVTVKIVPDYKYQFTAGKLNDTTLAPDVNNVSTFTFTMPSTNLHLSALFTYTEDKMVISAAGVSGAAITGGENVIDSGNLELTVKDFTDESKKSSLQSSTAASGLQVSQWLEVDLKQIVKQGSSDSYWETSKDELPQKIKVTLMVGTDLDETKEYVVVREHNGVYERIPATYDKAAGTLTFESDKFSDYAVGTVVSAAAVLGTIDSNWPDGAASSATDAVNVLVSTYGATGIAGAVQTSDGTVSTTLLDKLSALEDDYASEKTITVNAPTIASAVSESVSGTVKVTGAAFNVDDHSSVQLVIGDKAGSGITVGNSYRKSVQLDISLMKTALGSSNATAVTGALRMPVTITMPVPTGIDASRLVILHDKDGDGTSDETVPYSLAGNLVTLTLTHCSNFAFAEKAGSATGGESTGGGSADSSSSDDDDDDDSSSASAKEEKVNVPVEYTVVKGDTLSKIAYKNHMTLSALLALNPQIKNSNLIYPGQKIIVGHTSKTAASQSVSTINSNAVYYTVQKGDFLYRIARENGLTLAQLGAMNPEIVKQKYIYAGQKVRIK